MRQIQADRLAPARICRSVVDTYVDGVEVSKARSLVRPRICAISPCFSIVFVRYSSPDFKQPDWGQKVSGPFSDATGLSFGPSAQFNDEAFELWIDDVELLKAP